MKIEAKKVDCPGCGAYLVYDVDRLSCHYCGYERKLDLVPYTLDYRKFKNYTFSKADLEFGCPSCSATFDVPDNMYSGFCPYCDTPLLGEFLNEFRYRSFIPFEISHDEAGRLLKEKIGSLWFAPNDFKSFFKNYKELKAYYFPAWIFRFGCYVNYRGKRGEDYFVTRRVYINGKVKNVTQRETRWYPVSGELNLNFNDVLNISFLDVPQQIRYFSFDVSRSVKSIEEAFSGEIGYEYNIEPVASFEAVKAYVEGDIRAAIRRDIGGDRQLISDIGRKFYDVEMDGLFVPVYWGSVKWRDREYNYFINGQTGQVVGERPYSWVKIAFAIIGTIALIVITILLLQYFGVLDDELGKSLLIY